MPKELSAAHDVPETSEAGNPASAHGVDACATCGGARGGVPGNENMVDGKPMCDYCHGDLIRTHGVTAAHPAGPPTLSARWCGHCGEGVTNFCRGKSEACPMEFRKPGSAGVALPDGGQGG
jgi:hypothetical protein